MVVNAADGTGRDTSGAGLDGMGRVHDPTPVARGGGREGGIGGRGLLAW